MTTYVYFYLSLFSSIVTFNFMLSLFSCIVKFIKMLFVAALDLVLITSLYISVCIVVNYSILILLKVKRYFFELSYANYIHESILSIFFAV